MELGRQCMVCPGVRNKYGERGFSFAGPQVWNSFRPETVWQQHRSRSCQGLRLNFLICFMCDVYDF